MAEGLIETGSLLPAAVRAHALGGVAESLGTYLELPCGAIRVVQLLSFAAGKMALPIHLDLATNNLTAELLIAHRLFAIAPDNVVSVDGPSQLKKEEKTNFGLAVILVSGQRRGLFRQATEAAVRMGLQFAGSPSVWRITDAAGIEPGVGPVLRLMTEGATSSLDGFAEAYAAPMTRNATEGLRGFLDRLPRCPNHPWPFRSQARAQVEPDEKLVVERLLQVLGAVRIASSTQSSGEQNITLADYWCLRSLLVELPVMAVDIQVSANAIKTAETVYEAIADSSYQLTLPDRSTAGSKWFVAGSAAKWTGLAHNTIKQHLLELEDGNCSINNCLQ